MRDTTRTPSTLASALIVWRDTLRVGCAHRTCDTNSPFGAQLPSWDFWVCDYEPPGNFVGRRPY